MSHWGTEYIKFHFVKLMILDNEGGGEFIFAFTCSSCRGYDGLVCLGWQFTAQLLFFLGHLEHAPDSLT